MDELEEYNYLDLLFGQKSTLDFDVFVIESKRKKAISEIWYKPQMLRNLIFTKLEHETEETDEFLKFCEKNWIPIEESDEAKYPYDDGEENSCLSLSPTKRR